MHLKAKSDNIPFIFPAQINKIKSVLLHETQLMHFF